LPQICLPSDSLLTDPLEMLTPPDSSHYDALLQAAFAEDVGSGDCTTQALVSKDERGVGTFQFRQNGILAGGIMLEPVFRKMNDDIQVELHTEDGEFIQEGAIIALVTGPLQALLAAERIALNFVQRLSGIATLTNTYVNAVSDCPAEILDTRKTLPGWRGLAKFAVRAGGGRNHRIGLYDQVMIKDNHLAVIQGLHHCTLPEAVALSVTQARERCPDLRIEVEVEDFESFCAAVHAGADIIMLDNLPTIQMARMVEHLDSERSPSVPDRPILEASGGITLENVHEVARTGVDWISVGALTHSAPAADIALEITQVG
jgi:nicotinate-nucleotide pyrophosphorylase (carboxylating)